MAVDENKVVQSLLYAIYTKFARTHMVAIAVYEKLTNKRKAHALTMAENEKAISKLELEV
jgi:hypothetical protein